MYLGEVGDRTSNSFRDRLLYLHYVILEGAIFARKSLDFLKLRDYYATRVSYS
jgi:hypothetical protein